jgi:hypothetical protein
MEKGREIYFWHGFNKKIHDTLLPICVEALLANGKEGLIYYDSLDAFAKHYGRPFIVSDNWIAVTQCNTFGQR